MIPNAQTAAHPAPPPAPAPPARGGPVAARIASMVRRDTPDLSLRQIGILAQIASGLPGDRTVRSIAADLKISKPAVTRGLDRLEELQFARREADPRDARSIIVAILPAGRAWLRTLEG